MAPEDRARDRPAGETSADGDEQREGLPSGDWLLDVVRQRRSADTPGGGWPQLPEPVTAQPSAEMLSARGRHAAERRAGRMLIRAEFATCAAVASVGVLSGHTPAVGVAVAWWALQALGVRRDARTRGILSSRSSLVRGYVALPPVMAAGAVATGSFDTTQYVGALGILVLVSVVLRKVLELPRLRRRWGDTPSRLVLVGSPVQLERAVSRFRRRADIELVGVSVDPGRTEYSPGRRIGAPVVARLDGLAAAVRELHVDQVRVLSGGLRELDLEALAWDLERTPADLVLETSLAGVSSERITSTDVGGSGVVIRSFRANLVAHRVRAVLDRTLGAILLALSAPLLLVIAAAVRLSSPGPALFRQTRVGLGGEQFTMLKFRTMVIDAEERLAELIELNSHGDGVLFKMQSDPRVTRVGRFLRIASLDELPQLVNVVRGHMSLVGPRPALPREVERYDNRATRRLVVKPGLTGLWQVSGRSSLGWEESIGLDLDYVDNWTLVRDVKILARTAGAVVRREGAY